MPFPPAALAAARLPHLTAVDTSLTVSLGRELAADIPSPWGTPLARKGQRVTLDLLDGLHDLGFTTVPVVAPVLYPTTSETC